MSVAASLVGWVAAGLAAALIVGARRAFEHRMEAVTRACHELRGPITAVRLGLSCPTRPGELSAARLRAIDVELDRATLALDDLAAVRGGPPRLRAMERVDVRALVCDSVEAWAGGARAAGADLHMSWTGGASAVYGDRLRLAQATGNLIANAIQHGGGVVEVRGSVRESGTRIEVIDDGPGLPAPVAQLSRRARHGRGVHGRGLAIASAIAQAHGGRVAAAPVQRGARVVLELPASPGQRTTLRR